MNSYSFGLCCCKVSGFSELADVKFIMIPQSACGVKLELSLGAGGKLLSGAKS